LEKKTSGLFAGNSVGRINLNTSMKLSNVHCDFRTHSEKSLAISDHPGPDPFKVFFLSPNFLWAKSVYFP
jgi:hypothetical protein